MHVWLRQSPRCLFLVNSTLSAQSGRSVLVISTAAAGSSSNATSYGGESASSSSSSATNAARAVVEMVSIQDVDFTSCVRLTEDDAMGQAPAGCLGLMNVASGEQAGSVLLLREDTYLLSIHLPFL